MSIKKIIKKIILKHINPPRNSYSEAGEDRIICFLFKSKKIKKIRYLDVGVNDPEWSNNTMVFYLEGSTGVLVEANKSKIEHIKKIRPNDVVLNVGVSVNGKTEADFYVFDLPAISTFDKKEANRRQLLGDRKIIEVIRVPLVDINTIIEQNFHPYPDLLSLDIEGLDKEVLQSLKYPIPVICVETCSYSEDHVKPKDENFNELMKSKGYFVYADTYINTVYVNKEWFY